MKLSMQDLEKPETVLITEEHSKQLPVIRITKIVLQDFKNVEYGEINFHCGKDFVPYGTKSDILGLYGQNGSGKTAVIDALYILKQLLRGSKVQDLFSECVNKNAPCAKLTFLFELQYKDERVRKAQYEFCLKSEEVTVDTEERMDAAPDYFALPQSKFRVVVFNEVLSMSGPFHGSDQRMNPVIDTTGEELPFGPKSRHKFIIGLDKGNRKAFQLEVNKRLAIDRSQSFIFMNDSLKKLKEYGSYSEYLQVILELNHFGSHYLFVVNTRSSGLIRLNLAMLLHTPRGSFTIQTDGPYSMHQDVYDKVSPYIPKVSSVLSQLIPGLSIELRTIGKPVMSDGSTGQLVEALAIRNGTVLPLRDESDGIRRLISMLSLLTAAYNDPSFTLAIDEFDAGIFEYIWGEMLEIFAESGKGQLIFTAHNLRPLEVISKKFLYFTGTDPRDRYMQLKSIARTNNMRNVYFRQIEHGNEEKVYNETKRRSIKEALQEAKE
ncbi:MAG: AAA family ATPase [Acidaminococcaceae bacterium]|nr:AAA family ATPase [Acidaminococcaceae bacterium]